jgi:predicted deacylase
MPLFKTYRRKGVADGPHVLVTAGIHGDEHEGVVALQKLAADPFGLDAGCLTIVPIVNESAYADGCRMGSDGLDLARVFPGDSAGSHTERIAASLSRLIATTDLYIDLHSGGMRLVMEPLVGYMLVSGDEVVARQRAMARAFGLSTVWGTSQDLPGRSLSVARDAGVAAIYAEYLGGGRCSDEGVNAYHQGCLNVLAWAGMIPGSVPDNVVKRHVEDSRPGSGHLQTQHRSPVNGGWKALPALGAELQKGDLLGYVHVPEAGCREPAFAECSGRLIGVRVDGYVDQGDSLAVILEYV